MSIAFIGRSQEESRDASIRRARSFVPAAVSWLAGDGGLLLPSADEEMREAARAALVAGDRGKSFLRRNAASGKSSLGADGKVAASQNIEMSMADGRPLFQPGASDTIAA